MRVAFSELCLIGGQVAENVRRLTGAGARCVELMLDGEPWDSFHLRMDDLAAQLTGLGAEYAVHVPVWDANLTSENAHLRQAVMEAYRQSILFAHKLGARHVTLHPGFCNAPAFSKGTARRRSRESLLELLEFSGGFPLPLLVENVGSPATSIYTMEQYLRCLDGLPPQAGFLLDVGHAHAAGWDIPAVIRGAGERLLALHLHDNDGTGDTHLPMGAGTVDWEEVFAALDTLGHEVTLILEYNIGTPLIRLAEGKRLLEERFRC